MNGGGFFRLSRTSMDCLVGPFGFFAPVVDPLCSLMLLLTEVVYVKVD